MKHIEAGWKSLEQMAVPRSASDTQRKEMRKAFFAGASMLFTLVTRGMSEGDDAQQSDMDLLNEIADEVNAFGAELDAELLKRPAGHG